MLLLPLWPSCLDCGVKTVIWHLHCYSISGSQVGGPGACGGWVYKWAALFCPLVRATAPLQPLLYLSLDSASVCTGHSEAQMLALCPSSGCWVGVATWHPTARAGATVSTGQHLPVLHLCPALLPAFLVCSDAPTSAVSAHRSLRHVSWAGNSCWIIVVQLVATLRGEARGFLTSPWCWCPSFRVIYMWIFFFTIMQTFFISSF